MNAPRLRSAGSFSGSEESGSDGVEGVGGGRLIAGGGVGLADAAFSAAAAAPTTAAARDGFGTSSAAGVLEASKPPDGRAAA